MDKSLSPTHEFIPERLAKVLASLALGLAASVLMAHLPPRPTAARPPNRLMHWRNAQHDWLLVADRRRAELVVYDANDGRPLFRQRLQGDGWVGPWLLESDQPRRRVMSPPLTPLANR